MVSKHGNRKFSEVVSFPVSSSYATARVFEQPEMNEQALVRCPYVLPVPAEKVIVDWPPHDGDLPRFRQHLDIERQVIVPAEILVEPDSVRLEKMPAVEAPPYCWCLEHHRVGRSGDDSEITQLNREPLRVLFHRAILRIHVEKLSLRNIAVVHDRRPVERVDEVLRDMVVAVDKAHKLSLRQVQPHIPRRGSAAIRLRDHLHVIGAV